MQSTSLLWSIILSTFLHVASSFTPCPFNEDECRCTPHTTHPPTVWYAGCKSKTGDGIVTFTASPNGKYSITENMDLEGNMADLPADYFAPFSQIVGLNFNNTKRDRPQNWADTSFGGCAVQYMTIQNLDGMFPIPTALTQQGPYGLITLSVQNGTVPVTINDNGFQAFWRLQRLSIYDLPVSQISAEAFSGLERTLIGLSLMQLSMATDFPWQAMYGLKALTSLYLKQIGLKNVPMGALSNLVALQEVTLNGDLAPSIDAGALDDLPPSLASVTLQQCGLTKVPGRILLKNAQITQLYLDSKLYNRPECQRFSRKHQSPIPWSVW